MKVIALSSWVAFGALGLTACVTNANRCLPGFEFSASYDACLDLDGGADSAAAPSTAPDAGGDSASANDAGGGGEGGAGASAADLGKVCNGASDCSGLSNYCLKSPENPSAPGYCSIPNCTAGGECTSAYQCCACAAAALSELQALPIVCVDLDDSATLVSFGCTCQ
jgi:hypothetical protein